MMFGHDRRAPSGIENLLSMIFGRSHMPSRKPSRPLQIEPEEPVEQTLEQRMRAHDHFATAATDQGNP